MKYKIGEMVDYCGDLYKVISVIERTVIKTYEDNKKDVDLDIYYTLEDSDGDIEYDILEEYLSPYEKETKGSGIDFVDGREYALRNGLIVTYDDVWDKLSTDDGISIPIDLYNKQGKCLACDDLDIVNVKSVDKEHEDEDTEEHEYSLFDSIWKKNPYLNWLCREDTEDEDDDIDSDDDDDDMCDDCLYNHSDDDDTEIIDLKSDDGEYRIYIKKSPAGVSVKGNIPDDKRDFVINILKRIGDFISD